MQIPRKLQAGDRVKQSTYQTINGIIDYLHTQKIVGDNQSIKVSQQTSGVTISAIKNPHGTAGTVTANVHPFKLYIINADGVQKLQVYKGVIRTAINDVEFSYDNLILPTVAGVYNVYGYIQYNGTFTNGVFLQSTTYTVTKTRGFYPFKIGAITVATDGTYQITEQNIYSDLEIIDDDLTLPFVVYMYNSSTLHNAIVSANVVPDTYKVNGGNIYVDTHNNHSSSSISGTVADIYIYLQLTVNNPESHGAMLKSSSEVLTYFIGESTTDDLTDVYNILIAQITSTGNITQKIVGDMIFGLTNYPDDGGGGGVDGKDIVINSETLKISTNETNTQYTFDIDFEIGDSANFFKIQNKQFVLNSSIYGLVYNTSNSLGILSPPSTNQYVLTANDGVMAWNQQDYFVKVTATDEADYLGTKIVSTDQSVTISVNANNKLDLSVDSRIKVNDSDPVASWLQDKIYSSDNSVSISVKTSASGYKLDLSATGGGKVLVDETDTQADFLGDKLISIDRSVTFSKVDGSTDTKLDLSASKVKLYSDDATAGYLEEKIKSDASLLNLLLLMPIDDVLQLVCTASNCLFYADADKNIQKINLPDGDGDFALTFSSSTGGFKWVKITDCENACSQESSSTGA